MPADPVSPVPGGGMSDNSVPDDKVVVARITGVFGVRGWLKLHSFTQPLDNLLGYRNCYLQQDGVWRPVVLDEGHRQGKGLVGHLQGVDDRDQAAALRDCELAVDRSQLPALAVDEYYWHQLQGLRVRTVDGDDLGVVDHLLETGANDVLVVQGDAHSLDRRERLIPWNPGAVVTDVNVDAGQLVVDWDPEF